MREDSVDRIKVGLLATCEVRRATCNLDGAKMQWMLEAATETWRRCLALCYVEAVGGNSNSKKGSK
jgi:hypothetical protein